MNAIYLRVSTSFQDTENQLLGIEKYMRENNMEIDRRNIFRETVSGKVRAEDRLLSSDVLDRLQKGDTLIVSEISRIGRNMTDVIMNIDALCNKKKCSFIAVKQNLNFKPDDINSKVILLVYTMAAEIERDLNCSRTREALARIRAEGKILGRRLKLSGMEINPALPITEIARRNNVHKLTVIRYVRNHRKDLVYRKRSDYLVPVTEAA